MTSEELRPPFPPFNADSARAKVRAAENAWNTRNPARVALAYSADSIWRNRSEFIHGREEIVAFLTRKWNHKLDYRLIKDLWARTETGTRPQTPDGRTRRVVTLGSPIPKEAARRAASTGRVVIMALRLGYSPIHLGKGPVKLCIGYVAIAFMHKRSQ